MVSRRNQLLSAINSAKGVVTQTAPSDSSKAMRSNADGQVAKSKLSRLIGKNLVHKPRKSLLTRVGVPNRPTFDIIADGILGSQSIEYQPKLSVQKPSSEVTNIVSERIKNLRERTLNKISSNSEISGDGFFGFESDGTPVWSSVVTGARKIENKEYEQNKPQSPYHHSTQIPIKFDWPKRLAPSTHNTFKNYYVVAENKRATQLAQQVIDFTGQKLNPIVFVGDSGTGKSHLLNAIGQAILLHSDVAPLFVRKDELPHILTQQQTWTDVFTQTSMILIDDIDASLHDDNIANKLGTMLEAAINMNVHVVVSAKSLPTEWPASRLWDLLRSGVKTILTPVGAGSLMRYARNLAINKSIALTDDQLALIVTSGTLGWRATKNAIEKIELAVDSGETLLDSTDVYNLLNDIQTDNDVLALDVRSERVEDIANRLISDVIDVVYSDQEFGGIEFNTDLPTLSDDYQPPELDLSKFSDSSINYVESQINTTLQNLTPEAPSVIDVNDRDKHLVAKMNRIIERDHAIAADILTDLDMGIDMKLQESDDVVRAETNLLVNLESELLNLAERTSSASIEDLIGIADELRDVEQRLVAIDSERADLPEFVDDDVESALDSYVPSNDWNLDGSVISVEELIEEESILTPIDKTLQPHPEGAIAMSELNPVGIILDGEEE